VPGSGAARNLFFQFRRNRPRWPAHLGGTLSSLVGARAKRFHRYARDRIPVIRSAEAVRPWASWAPDTHGRPCVCLGSPSRLEGGLLDAAAGGKDVLSWRESWRRWLHLCPGTTICPSSPPSLPCLTTPAHVVRPPALISPAEHVEEYFSRERTASRKSVSQSVIGASRRFGCAAFLAPVDAGAGGFLNQISLVVVLAYVSVVAF
jgi:hypothetical protein